MFGWEKVRDSDGLAGSGLKVGHDNAVSNPPEGVEVSLRLFNRA